jgi:hypothetical protein
VIIFFAKPPGVFLVQCSWRKFFPLPNIAVIVSELQLHQFNFPLLYSDVFFGLFGNTVSCELCMVSLRWK